MDDPSDPFDIKNLTTPELQAAEAAVRADLESRKRNGDKPEWLRNKIAASSTGKAAPKRARSPRRFTKIPGLWEEALAKARVSGSTYAVATVLLHEAWKSASNGYRPDVKVTNVMLKRVHVGRKGKRAALLKLSGLGLVSVQWRGKRNPIATVHFFD
jgi:hypothetical protein